MSRSSTLRLYNREPLLSVLLQGDIGLPRGAGKIHAIHGKRRKKLGHVRKLLIRSKHGQFSTSIHENALPRDLSGYLSITVQSDLHWWYVPALRSKSIRDRSQHRIWRPW